MSATLRDAPEPAGPTEPDIRPWVATRQSRLPVYLFIAGMALLAALLFNALNARRQALGVPEARPVAADLAQNSSNPPTLFVPPSFEDGEFQPRYMVEAPPPPLFGPRIAREPADTGDGLRISQPPLRVYQPPVPTGNFGQQNAGPASEPPRGAGSPVLVIDVSTVEAGAAPQTAGTPGAAAGSVAAGALGASRVRSGRLANPSTTVPQGTSIPAVLETALDSTRPGQARALVSLDVRGFDGTRVLIPRGSRLYGEYEADLQAGQNRALIQWTRLLRPDGVTIAIGSPAGDRLGRAGLRGKVNSHFFERFFSAVLQSSLDVGVAVASRSVGNGGVVLLPGNLGQALPKQTEIKPTLTVKQGRSISVLVARDLDFATAAGR